MIFLRLFWFLIPTLALWMADGGSGSGDGGGKAAPPADPAGAFESLKRRYDNDLGAVAQKLFDENYQYRTRIRDLETETTNLKGKLPAEGAVVLSGDSAAQWDAYRALGKPDEIKTTLAGYAHLKRDGLLRQAAEAHGYKAAVLSQLASSSLQIELGEIEVDGQKKPIAYVVEGETRTQLDQYAQSKWSDFMPSLQPAQSQGGGAGQSNGTTYIQQKSGGRATGSGDKVKEFIDRQRDAGKLEKPII